MQRPDHAGVRSEAVKQVWSVREYAKRHQLDDVEEARLRQLFGTFATAAELRHNVKRVQRSH